MKIGVVFPQTDIGQDPAVIRDYAQAVEAMGYTHILAFDSVVGVNPDRPGGWDSQFTYRHAFHEPFVLFGFCAAVTRRIELVTGIIILPQRQTALVAKQAAEVDVLSGGRLRLGIGVGWNQVEFEALGETFENRGKRVEEQLEVMRLLWTRELLTYAGQWHRVPDAGLKVFLTADPAARAERRSAEMTSAHDRKLSKVEAALVERDRYDSSRPISPLTAADDAVTIDTTYLTLGEVIDQVADLALARVASS